MKTCKKHPDREAKKGLLCELCIREYNREWEQNHKEARKKYRMENFEKIKIYQKAYYKSHYKGKKPVKYSPLILEMIKTHTARETAYILKVTPNYVNYVARKNNINALGKKGV